MVPIVLKPIAPATRPQLARPEGQELCQKLAKETDAERKKYNAKRPENQQS